MVTDNCTQQTDVGAIAPTNTEPNRMDWHKKERAAQMMAKDYRDKRKQRLENARQPLMLRVKLEELAKYTHVALQQFPKRERFIICADIKETIYEALQLTIRMERRYHKKTTLQDIDVSIDFLRVLIRESCSLGYISPNHLADWMKQVDECGMILGGLMKHFAK